MVPLHKDLYDSNRQCIPQPLYFINSYTFQWVQNVQKMMLLTKPPKESGFTDCRVLTLK